VFFHAYIIVQALAGYKLRDGLDFKTKVIAYIRLELYNENVGKIRN